MGAYTSLYGFDSRRHAREVAPALIALLRDGDRGLAQHGPAGARLLEILERAELEWARVEREYQEHYARHPRGSELLAEIRAGLGLDLVQACETLDAELGAVHEGVSDLIAIVPSLSGGCTSTDCALRQRCPFHPLNRRPLLAEIMMDLFQQLVMSSSRSEPVFQLGKDFVLHQLIAWYSYELGHDDDEAEARFMAAQDELPLLLARLCKRGGIWGWGDGGFGEGLLGWLSPEEASRLAEALSAYELSPAAPIPPGLSDPYVGEQVLPELRGKLVLLRDAAAAFADRGLGILLKRS